MKKFLFIIPILLTSCMLFQQRLEVRHCTFSFAGFKINEISLKALDILIKVKVKNNHNYKIKIDRFRCWLWMEDYRVCELNNDEHFNIPPNESQKFSFQIKFSFADARTAIKLFWQNRNNLDLNVKGTVFLDLQDGNYLPVPINIKKTFTKEEKE